MECAEDVLETGFGKEMGLKSSPQISLDELFSSNAQNVTTCDELFVDQLLDFSNEDGFIEEEPEGEEEENKHSFSSGSASPLKLHDGHENSIQSSPSSTKDDFWSVSSHDLEEDLKWLSNLVADSLQEYSAPAPSFDLTESPINQENHTQPRVEIAVSVSHMQSFLESPLPSKPRSKRARIGRRVWTFSSPFQSDVSSSSITSSSSCSSLSSPLTVLNFLERPPVKKPKRKFEGTGGVQSSRRCSHCGVQKTPQWRAGPQGAKTLCNACGVRYKSGRLLPEYRPACSPTFSSELHSNHHRKVLEMRRMKETEFSGAIHPVVPSFSKSY